MKVTAEVNNMLLRAYEIAKVEKNEYITPEHLLYSSTYETRVKKAIEKCGGDLRNLQYNLKKYIETYIDSSSKTPQESFSFQQVIMQADAQVRSSGKEAIEIEHIFAAIYDLEQSYALYYLLEEGINKRELLFYMCHSDDEDDDEYEDAEYDSYEDDEDDEDEIQKRFMTSESIHEEDINEKEIKQEPKKDKKDKFLEKFTTDLIKKISEEEIDPLVGRKDILDRTIQVLCRKTKNNPVHVGEPGVGKTAIILGLARLIKDNQVPKKLQGSTIYSLDIGSVLAGTKYRGDFEERIKKILDSISKKDKPIVYIDEIHNIVGAGSLSGGSLDASNLLKPYLSEGRVRFIGSTTFDEYKKYFEKDKALTRRFQTIDVNEPSINETIEILQGLKESYEKYYDLTYTDEALRNAAELSDKYINDRFLPDKAIDVIDEAGAYLSIQKENGGKSEVDKDVIEEVISKMCFIPKQTVETSEISKLQNIEAELKKNVFNQDTAIEEVVRCIKMSRAGLNDENKPISSMLFVGPTGVGKTEIAKCLSNVMGIDLVRFDMSEYGEKHSAAKLIGSPPGYVGYEEGGMLTDAIRKKPHCVLLLDEIEKAHPDILGVLLQVMDYATLTDNKGRKADFKNVILIMTSNAGARNIGKKIIGFGNKEIQGEAITEEVKKYFTPEFRNRLDKIIAFNGINDKMAKDITVKKLDDFKKKLESKNVEVEFTENCINHIAEIGTSKEFGAREIIRVIDGNVKPLFIDELLFGGLKDGGKCTVDFAEDKFKIDIK